MSMFREVSGGIEWRSPDQFLRVEAWGEDSVRVRSGVGRLLEDLPGALLDRPASPSPTIDLPVASSVSRSAEAAVGSGSAVSGPPAVLRHGRLRVEISPAGLVCFLRDDGVFDGAELLVEQRAHFWWPGARNFTSVGNGKYRIEQLFRAYDGERLYGLGQHQHGLLDQKGAIVELLQRNTEVSIPFLLSNRGYGLLWNNPAIGSVEMGTTGTRWVAHSAQQIDYWLTTAPTPSEILSRYADATGHSPVLPQWATGFWQSKLRYRNQEELLEVAREYHERALPLSVIVADFLHWPALGDWKFDETDWPDPKAMVAELDSMGVKLMVSIWPSVNPVSENWEEFSQDQLLIGAEAGLSTHTKWIDTPSDSPAEVAFYDSTNPLAREAIWNTVKRNYGDLGINVFWLDACEPEIVPLQPANMRFWAGNGMEVANLYPREHARAFWEGMAAERDHDGMSFARSAWAGSQRYGAALWSGDIGVDFATFQRQIAAGLNTAISGIPWWCADIGGFHGGDPDDPAYQELMIRWFQFGAFSPLFRMHGYREPHAPLGRRMTGGPNEVWSYGEHAYAIMTSYLALRERLRPYLQRQMATAASAGIPPMRPLFLEFPKDPDAWTIADQFFLGPDLLVAPIVEADARSRSVYLPTGAMWTDAWTGEHFSGGARYTVHAPLERIPLFLRDGARLPILDTSPTLGGIGVV